jgi:hypothetical protein
MPKNAKHAPAKGRKRGPLPVIALDKIRVAIPIADGPLSYRQEADGLHVAGWRTDGLSHVRKKPAPAKMTTRLRLLPLAMT